jgi:hypothetical protein
MKVYIENRVEERTRLLALGVDPEWILPNGNLMRAGLPSEDTLKAAGLRLPFVKEGKYINSLLGKIQPSRVWARDRIWSEAFGEIFTETVYISKGIEVFGGDSARLVLVEDKEA